MINIAVIRPPGQGLEFMLDSSIKKELPNWLNKELLDLENNVGKVFDIWIKAGNRYTGIAPLRETKIVGMLKEKGYSVNFIDYLIGDTKENELLEFKHGNLKVRFTNYGSLRLSHHDKNIYEESKKKLEQRLEGKDIVMISAPFAYENPTYAIMINMLKELGKKVVVGGPDAYVNPEVYIRYGADLVFRGDFNPENESFKKLIRNEKLKDNEKITEFSFLKPESKLADPNNIADFTDFSKYDEGHDGPLPEWVYKKLNNSPVWGIMFSYGCPTKPPCNFCDTPLWSDKLGKKRFQYMDIDEAKNVIDLLTEKNVKVIDILDDNLLATPKEYLKELFDYMTKKDMFWNFPGGLLVGRLIKDPELINIVFPKFKDENRGFNLYHPLEAVHKKDLDRETYKKLATLDGNISLIKELTKRKVRLGCGTILLKDYTQKYYNEIIEVYNKIKNNVGEDASKVRFSNLQPIPLGELRKDRIKIIHNIQEELILNQNIDEIINQGTMYFYLPSIVQDKNFSTGDMNKWPAFAQAYWLALSYKIDPENVISMIEKGKYDYSKK